MPVFIYDKLIASHSSCWNENCFRPFCRDSLYTNFEFNIFIWKFCRCWDTLQNIGIAGEVRDKNKIELMRITCWIIKATDAHSEKENFYYISTTTLNTLRVLNITLYIIDRVVSY